MTAIVTFRVSHNVIFEREHYITFILMTIFLFQFLVIS